MNVARRTAQPNPSQSQANTDPDNEDDEAETDPTKLFGVLVHVRSFLKFLNSHVVSTTTIACTSCFTIPLTVSHFSVYMCSWLPFNVMLYVRALIRRLAFSRHMPTPLHDSLRLYWRGGRCRWGVNFLYSCSAGGLVLFSW